MSQTKNKVENQVSYDKVRRSISTLKEGFSFEKVSQNPTKNISIVTTICPRCYLARTSLSGKFIAPEPFAKKQQIACDDCGTCLRKPDSSWVTVHACSVSDKRVKSE